MGEAKRALACMRCAKMHIKCEWVEKESEPGPSGSVNMEAIRRAVRKELEAVVLPVLQETKHGNQTGKTEALKNWELWGDASSGYGHLPKISPYDLVRRKVEIEPGSEEEVVEVVHQLEPKMMAKYERKRVEGRGSKPWKGKGKAMEED